MTLEHRPSNTRIPSIRVRLGTKQYFFQGGGGFPRKFLHSKNCWTSYCLPKKSNNNHAQPKDEETISCPRKLPTKWENSVFHDKIISKVSRNATLLQINHKFCVMFYGGKSSFLRTFSGGLKEIKPFDLNCKFSHLIIHVLLSPTRAERWRRELMVLNNGNVYFFLSKFKPVCPKHHRFLEVYRETR